MIHPVLLAIDTCEATCSAALVRQDEVLARRMERIGRGHAERLLPMLDEMLTEAGMTYGDLGRIAVCTGPGTFTGLRIGLSVARGLALAGAVPCVGLMSLPVLAAQAQAAEAAVVHAIVMGRGGQGFYQPFRAVSAGMPVALAAAVCLDGTEISQLVRSNPGPVVGSGATLGGAESPIDAVDPVKLARLSQALDPEAFPPEPAYLRDADAKKGKPLLPVER